MSSKISKTSAYQHSDTGHLLQVCETNIELDWKFGSTPSVSLCLPRSQLPHHNDIKKHLQVVTAHNTIRAPAIPHHFRSTSTTWTNSHGKSSIWAIRLCIHASPLGAHCIAYWRREPQNQDCGDHGVASMSTSSWKGPKIGWRSRPYIAAPGRGLEKAVGTSLALCFLFKASTSLNTLGLKGVCKPKGHAHQTASIRAAIGKWIITCTRLLFSRREHAVIFSWCHLIGQTSAKPKTLQRCRSSIRTTSWM